MWCITRSLETFLSSHRIKMTKRHVCCVLLSESNLTKFPSSPAPIPLLPRPTLCYIFIFSASTKWQQEVLGARAVDLNRNCGSQLGLGKWRDFPGKVRGRSSTLSTISYGVFGTVLHGSALACPHCQGNVCDGWGMGNKIVPAKMPVRP